MPDLFTFGEALALFLSTDTDNVVDAREYKRSTAGAEGNVSVALSRLGLKSTFFARLGNDELGSAILNDFIVEGVDVSLVKRVPEFTSAMVRNPGTTRGVEVTYLRKSSAASTMVASDINIDAMQSARWIHSTGITCAISKTGTFTGGVIAGLLAGLSAHDAIVQGSRGGALVASSFGDWAGLPYGKLGIINPENGGN